LISGVAAELALVFAEHREQAWRPHEKPIDIKLHLSPRRYLDRNLSAAQVWESIPPQFRDSPVQQAAFNALAGGMMFSGFQQRALPHIRGRYGARGLSGSVVSAGTGAGKTKSFYIPAFLGIVTDLHREPFTKVIAIYPRNVLLADQLREALSEAAKLRPALARHGLRSLTFGALLGNTPKSQWFEERPDRRHYKVRNADGCVPPTGSWFHF
jgi:ATP-dependent helicase YprA (DUF1998 family)